MYEAGLGHRPYRNTERGTTCTLQKVPQLPNLGELGSKFPHLIKRTKCKKGQKVMLGGQPGGGSSKRTARCLVHMASGLSVVGSGERMDSKQSQWEGLGLQGAHRKEPPWDQPETETQGSRRNGSE